MAVPSDHPQALWFLDTLVLIRVSEKEGEDGVSVLEHWARQGDSPPLHIHHGEDEIFHVLEGELRFQVDKAQHRLGPGQTLLAPGGIPHTYRVESEQGGRWLTVTAGGAFERFVRALSRPAERVELPPPGGEPSPEAIQALTAAAARFRIEIVGPPLR